ncbi:hypothetical protein GCM10009547_35050 [Sporichthya brevicatena]|uniref:Uncharacterized protein n=1 Tax=Sporichthya brevicatena TaxID=171442 RepID=A0ABN1H443_9ACTN
MSDKDTRAEQRAQLIKEARQERASWSEALQAAHRAASRAAAEEAEQVLRAR